MPSAASSLVKKVRQHLSPAIPMRTQHVDLGGRGCSSEFIFCFSVEAWLIHNVVLVLGVEQSGSAIHTYTAFRFLSPLGYNNILSIVPHAVQWVLAVYLFCM